MSLRTTLLVLLALVFAVGCSPRRGGGGGGGGDDDDNEDDDDVVDDDDNQDDDDNEDDDDVIADDDDLVEDDDDLVDDDDDVDFTFTGLSFSATLEVNGSSAEIEYVFSYWEDMAAGIKACDQHVQLDGDYGWGLAPPGCSDCTSVLEFDEGSAVDVSNPAADPDHCDPAVLDAAGANFGEALTTMPSDGYGDFLVLGVIDEGTMESGGLTADVSGDLDADEIQTGLDDYALVYTHSGLTEAYPDSLGDASGISAVADENGADFFFYFYFFINPDTNPNDGAEMDGEYGAQAHWIINFSP